MTGSSLNRRHRFSLKMEICQEKLLECKLLFMFGADQTRKDPWDPKGFGLFEAAMNATVAARKLCMRIL